MGWLSPEGARRLWATRRRHVVLNLALVAGLIVAGVLGWFGLHSGAPAAASTTAVYSAARGDVTSSVSATGNVMIGSSYDLSFPSSASSSTITSILVKVGDKVTAGQTLATVDATSLNQALAVAQAQESSAQAALDKLNGGLTAPERAQLQAQAAQSSVSVSNAQNGVANAEANLAADKAQLQGPVDSAQAAYQAAVDKQNQDAAPQQATLDGAKADAATAQQNLSAAQAAGDQGAIDTATNALTQAQQAVSQAQQALDTARQADQPAVAQALTALNTAKAALAAKVTTDGQAVTSAKGQLASAQAGYTVTVAGNNVKLEPAAPDQVAAATATLTNAQNNLATAQKNLAQATITAPVDGVITAVKGQVGQSAGSGGSSSSTTGGTTAATGSSSASSTSGSSSAVVSMADLNSLQIKAGFSEADATKVKVGQVAQITFDSLPTVRLTAKVASVDVTPTTVSNVVTYYAYLAFDQPPADGTVKPGMTATATVTVASVANVVYVPTAAVANARGTTANVAVELGNDPTRTHQVAVTLGLKGDNGVEITNGLTDTDKVVVTRSLASTASSTGATGFPGGGTGGLAGGGGGIAGGGGGAGGGAGGAGGGGRG